MGAEKEYIIMAQWQCEEIIVLSLFECSQQFLLELRHHSSPVNPTTRRLRRC